MRIGRWAAARASIRWTVPAFTSPACGQEAEGEQGGEVAGEAGQRAGDAEFGAIVAIVGIEGIADEAAVAGAAGEQADLALPLRGGGAEERQADSPRRHR